MKRRYKRLSYSDRLNIEKMCKAGKKVKEIADMTGAHRATIYHELERGGAAGGRLKEYSAETAQRKI